MAWAADWDDVLRFTINKKKLPTTVLEHAVA
jgi:hypothetical protein